MVDRWGGRGRNVPRRGRSQDESGLAEGGTRLVTPLSERGVSRKLSDAVESNPDPFLVEDLICCRFSQEAKKELAVAGESRLNSSLVVSRDFHFHLTENQARTHQARLQIS